MDPWDSTPFNKKFRNKQNTICKSKRYKILISSNKSWSPSRFDFRTLTVPIAYCTIIDNILLADDTNIFFSDKCLITLESRVNTEIQKISRWLKFNKLSLNIKKKQIILFLTKTKNKN